MWHVVSNKKTRDTLFLHHLFIFLTNKNLVELAEYEISEFYTMLISDSI